MKNHSIFRLGISFFSPVLLGLSTIGLLTVHAQTQTTTTVEARTATECGNSQKVVPQHDEECAGKGNCITDRLKSLKLSIPGASRGDCNTSTS
jgi:hypothetical protein